MTVNKRVGVGRIAAKDKSFTGKNMGLPKKIGLKQFLKILTDTCKRRAINNHDIKQKGRYMTCPLSVAYFYKLL